MFQIYDPKVECGNIIQRLKNICESKSISFYALAAKAGVSTSTVHNLMLGQTTPYVHTIYKLCNALEISVEEVFGINGAINSDKSERYVMEACEMGNFLTEDEKRILFYYRNFSGEKKDMLKVYINMLRQYDGSRGNR